MFVTKTFRKFVIASMLLGALTGYAQKRTLKFENTSPDILLQMNFNHYSSTFLVNRANEAFEAMKGIDIFDHTMHLPKFDPYVHDKGVADYIVGELGEQLAEVIDGELKGATTTFDVYDFHYKLSKPKLSINFSEVKDNGINLSLKFTISKLEVDVDAIYVNNHSPGVKVVRAYESGDKLTKVENAHLRRILDDIYLKVQSPEGLPLLKIDGGKDRRNDPLAVISGEITVRIEADENKNLNLSLQNFDVSLFGAETGEDLAKYIEIEVGGNTKIGGLESIELGYSDNELKEHSFKNTIQGKKVFFAELLAGPIIEQVYSEDIKKTVAEKINGIQIKPNFEQEIKDVKMKVTTNVNEFGIISRSESDLDKQLRVAIDVDAKRTDLKNYKWIPPYKVSDYVKPQKSMEFIYDEIASDRHSLILSLDQEFLNQGINAFLQGQEKTLLAAQTPDYVSIGKKGIFLMFDDQNQGKVVIDFLAREKFFKRMLMTVATGRSKYKFPGVFIPEFKIVMKDDVPTLLVNIKDIDLSDDTLNNGIYGLESNLDKGWLKKVVRKFVRDEFVPSIGSTMAEVPLPQLKGLPVGDIVEIRSDGNGRLNLMLDISPFKSKSRNVLNKIPDVVKNLTKKPESTQSK